MKLYTDNQGTWVGTQIEAKQLDQYEQIEVPTDKPNLLKFLNERRVVDYDAVLKAAENTEPTPVRERHHLSCSADPKWYDVRDAVLNCDRKDLSHALAAIITRLHEELEQT